MYLYSILLELFFSSEVIGVLILVMDHIIIVECRKNFWISKLIIMLRYSAVSHT